MKFDERIESVLPYAMSEKDVHPIWQGMGIGSIKVRLRVPQELPIPGKITELNLTPEVTYSEREGQILHVFGTLEALIYYESQRETEVDPENSEFVSYFSLDRDDLGNTNDSAENDYVLDFAITEVRKSVRAAIESQEIIFSNRFEVFIDSPESPAGIQCVRYQIPYYLPVHNVRNDEEKNIVQLIPKVEKYDCYILAPRVLDLLIELSISVSAQPVVVGHQAQETVQEAIQEAVQEAAQETVQEAAQEAIQEVAQETVQETIQEAVQETVQETIQEAVQEAVQEETVQTAVLDTVTIETEVSVTTDALPIVLESTEQRNIELVRDESRDNGLNPDELYAREESITEEFPAVESASTEEFSQEPAECATEVFEEGTDTFDDPSAAPAIEETRMESEFQSEFTSELESDFESQQNTGQIPSNQDEVSEILPPRMKYQNSEYFPVGIGYRQISIHQRRPSRGERDARLSEKGVLSSEEIKTRFIPTTKLQRPRALRTNVGNLELFDGQINGQQENAGVNASKNKGNHNHTGRRQTSATRYYVIQAGDTWQKLATDYQCTIAEIMNANPGFQGDLLTGQRLVIPPSTLH